MDFAVKHRHYVMHDGKSKSETVFCGGVWEAFKCPKYTLLFIFCHACACILENQCQHSVGIIDSQRHTAFLRELDGIWQQIVSNLDDSLLVGQYNRIVSVLYGQGKPLVHGDGHELRFKGMRDCGDAAGQQFGLLLAVVQAEEVQQGVKHIPHTVGRLLYALKKIHIVLLAALFL